MSFAYPELQAQPGAAQAAPSRLEAYALAGLARCWMPSRQSWSHQYHLDGRAQPNTSIPASDLYYSVNVLLGLSRLTVARPAYCRAADLLPQLVRAGEDEPVRDGFWGMALWAAACLDVSPPAEAVMRVLALGEDQAGAARWRAQDLGLAVSGASAQAMQDPAWASCARRLQQVLLGQLRAPGGLFRDCAMGARRHYGTFATQVYAALALYQYGEMAGDETSIKAANDCVRRLIALQGELGEWPWFYAPESGRVLDRYEVYSVHQHGMAPAVLHHAISHGVEGARAALVRGFEWVFGRNELSVPMLRPDLGMIVRSQARRFPYGGRTARLARAACMAMAGRDGGAAGAQALVLTQEMRSYELGWLLWSFAGRKEYSELTDRPAFGDLAAPSGAA